MKNIRSMLDKVKKESRAVLLEHEVYSILNSVGIKTPQFIFVDMKTAAVKEKLNTASKDVVVKVVSKDILHKTETGGVVFCANNVDEINKAVGDIKKHTAHYDVAGFMVVEKVSYKPLFGHELIVSVRNSKDFGTLLGFGVGGIDTEFFGSKMQGAFNVISADYDDINVEKIHGNAAYYKLGGLDRTKKRLLSDGKILDVLNKLGKLGREFGFENSNTGLVISECEINPIVVSEGGELVAIDGLMKIEDAPTTLHPRPLEKLEALFHPKSIAVAGVSGKSFNMGRIILNNIIERGFPLKDMCVIKSDTQEIDGVKCYASVSNVPKKMDLLVLAVSASSASDLIKESILKDKFESVIVIAGGFAERQDGKKFEEAIIDAVQKSRTTPGKGPILVGGNCLGIVSFPGKYNTFFMPPKKLIYSEPKPYAFISQSGGFIVSKVSKTDLTPYYSVSLGNQMDLTFSDYISFFKNRKEIKVIALYVEGFKHLDGIKTARAIRELKKAGKEVLIYKGGRSGAGKSAASGHTGAIAGDYPVYKAIMQDAGALVVENFSDFEDMLKIMLAFNRFDIKGKNIAVMSCAGFELVGMADNLGSLQLAKLDAETIKRITKALSDAKLDSIVSASNPLDVTPSANDAVNVESFKALLDDKNINAGIYSSVPLSPAVRTIKEELGPGSVVDGIAELWKTTKKPFAVVLDGGELFDPACKVLKDIPVFRESDRAVKAFAKYFEYRI
ncbi:MAG: acetate--CoA ligase family protein [Pseudomonadota bacterium]